MVSKARRTIPAKFSTGFMNSLDMRFAPSLAARRTYTELAQALGGAEHLSPQQLMLIERVVWTNLWLQQAEFEFATTGKGNANSYGQLVHTLVSLLKTLGLNRVARNVPSLAQYLEAEKLDA